MSKHAAAHCSTDNGLRPSPIRAAPVLYLVSQSPPKKLGWVKPDPQSSADFVVVASVTGGAVAETVVAAAVRSTTCPGISARVGKLVGDGVGSAVGAGVGSAVGDGVGSAVGDGVGSAVGSAVGSVVG